MQITIKRQPISGLHSYQSPASTERSSLIWFPSENQKMEEFINPSIHRLTSFSLWGFSGGWNLSQLPSGDTQHTTSVLTKIWKFNKKCRHKKAERVFNWYTLKKYCKSLHFLEKKGGGDPLYFWADNVAHGQKTLLNEYLKMRYSVTLFAAAIITANFSDTTQMKVAL